MENDFRSQSAILSMVGALLLSFYDSVASNQLFLGAIFTSTF